MVEQPSDASFADRARDRLKVQTDAGQLVPCVYMPIQLDLLALCEEIVARGELIRLLVGKARREGVSTFWQSYQYLNLCDTPNQHGIVLAHDKDGSNWLFQMAQRFKQHDEYSKATKYSSKQEIVFAEPHNSSISVQVAHGYAASSQGFRYAHLSEVAKWADAPTTMVSVLQTLQHAHMMLESTANGQSGVGKYWYELWQATKRGDTEYVQRFYGWQAHPQYSIGDVMLMSRMLNESRPPAFLEEEVAMVKAYDLTDGQVAWRRWAIKALCHNDIDAFRQEYPSNDTEMFLHVDGSRVFDMKRCHIGLNGATPPAVRGRLRWEVEPKRDPVGYCTNMSQLSVRFIEDSTGPLAIWTPPPPRDAYVANRFFCASDIAKGIKGGDFSCATILDRVERRVIAEWYERVDPTIWGAQLAMLGVWFNRELLIAPESNPPGDATINELTRLYLNVWSGPRHVPGNPYFQAESNRYGIFNSPGNHEFLCNHLVDVIREGLWHDPVVEFWQEAMGVVKGANGSTAISGKDRTAARVHLAVMDSLGPRVENRARDDENKPSDYQANKKGMSSKEESKQFTKKIGTGRYKGKDWRTQ